MELSKILDKFLKGLMVSSKKKLVPLEPYDQTFFQRLIPDSVLVKELAEKFIEEPTRAYNRYGEFQPEWLLVKESEKAKREQSCMFGPDEPTADEVQVMNLNKTAMQDKYIADLIRRQHTLFRINYNPENNDEVLEHLLMTYKKYKL